MPKGIGRPGKPGPKNIEVRIKKAMKAARGTANPLLVRTAAKMQSMKKKKKSK